MDQEEIGQIAVGDRVWWIPALHLEDEEELGSGLPLPPPLPRGYPLGFLSGKVRSIEFEEPDFVYGVIAADPDGRILQAPLHWLVKGMPPDPTPKSQESQENKLQPHNYTGFDLDMDVWGEAFAHMNATLFVSPSPASPPQQTRDEYFTPREVIQAARAVLAEIDLDPASCALAQKIVQANTFYTKADNGLEQAWRGRVWLNPPYSCPKPFVDKLLAEYNRGSVSAALVLLNNNTDTNYGQSLLKRFPVCFVGYGGAQGSRLAFWQQDPDEPSKGNRNAQMIFYLGPDVASFVGEFKKFGAVMVPISS